MADSYEQGWQFFAPGMSMSESDRCPFPSSFSAGKSCDGSKRTEWMSGFFDAYFQAFCDRNGLGKWGD